MILDELKQFIHNIVSNENTDTNQLREFVKEEIENTINNGGDGSGDFDHAGRPGEVGGSEPAGTGRNGKYKDGEKQFVGKKKEEEKTTEKVDKEEPKNKYHNFLKSKINDSWYKNAKLDYGIEGKLLDTSLKDDVLSITWEEQEPNSKKQTFKMDIPYASEYTKEQLYDVWMDQSFEPVVIEKESKNGKQEPKQLKLFNGLTTILNSYDYEELNDSDKEIYNGLKQILNDYMGE